ncbi:MAG: hypothetical protein B6242_17490 [Anaerolineaceae bacterium 4572_78]|nr:MAG: hypothetical protein B6242_17490 [Anaerolineaceae bacterium 4572_78]
MKIDCSEISNKSDLLAIAGMIVLGIVFTLAFLIAAYFDNFYAGFFTATIIWKWKVWIYKPIDQKLDKLWPPDRIT